MKDNYILVFLVFTGLGAIFIGEYADSVLLTLGIASLCWAQFVMTEAIVQAMSAKRKEDRKAP